MAHHHDHSHTHTHTANKQVLRISFFVIAGFMLVEAVGGWLTNSLALLSDAGHMFSDAFSLGMALWAFKLGEKQTTLQKTFGYKRFEILTAMFNGLSLVLIAAMIFYEAVKRLFYPPEILTGGMLVVSIIGLLVNIGVAVYMLKNGDTEENVNMRGAYLHVISDLFGSIGAIVAAVLMMAYGWQWADTVASVLVAALVGRSGWKLFKQTLHILMEGAPENIHTDELLSVIRNTEGVKQAEWSNHAVTVILDAGEEARAALLRKLFEQNLPLSEAAVIKASLLNSYQNSLNLHEQEQQEQQEQADGQ